MLKKNNKYVETVNKKGWTGNIQFDRYELEKPAKWKKPRQIFVCSMGDLFHENVPDKWIHQVMVVMFWASHHTYLILTKRPERMKDYVLNNRGILE
ncbi:unnamed protein product, partial [marine sediment metagenome]